MTFLLTLFLHASLLGKLGVAHAAEPAGEDPMSQDDPGVIPGVAPGPRPPPEQVGPLAITIGGKIRCPVCQGMSVADSSSPAAVQMQKRVKELVAAGYGEDDIIDFFVERYGEFLLLEPRRDSSNLIVWVGPGLGIGLGLALALRTMFVWRRGGDTPGTGAAAESAPTKDEYERRLLAELED